MGPAVARVDDPIGCNWCVWSIVLVHGAFNELWGPHEIAARWIPALEDGLWRVGRSVDPDITGLIGWELYGPGGAVYSIVVLTMLFALSTATSTTDEGIDVVAVDDPGAAR